MRVSDLAQGIVAVDWRLFPPDKTLAEVGWTPESVVFAAPRISAAAFLSAPAPPAWQVRNAEQPLDVVPVSGPTVGRACKEIAQTRKDRKSRRVIVLRAAGQPPFTNPGQQLPPGGDLEFIDSVEVMALAGRDYLEIESGLHDLDPAQWLDELRAKEYDRRAFMEEMRRRYPGIP
jgi:hypothetical protein